MIPATGWPVRSAAALSPTIRSGSVRSGRRLTCRTRIPAAVSFRSRRIVASQPSGARCHSRESTSSATPWSGHPASGLASSRPSHRSDALNNSCGGFDLLIKSRRSASAGDLRPSPTPASTDRNNPEPRTGPAANSAASSKIAHWPCCTAPATTALTCDLSVRPRTASATALARETYRTARFCVSGRGSRDVRWIATNDRLAHCRPAGTRTWMSRVAGALTS